MSPPPPPDAAPRRHPVARLASALSNLLPFRRRVRTKDDPLGAAVTSLTVPAAPEPALASRIAFSARLMAARRAIESEQPQPVFVDALAPAMAGPDALAAVRARPPFMPGYGPRDGDARLPVSFLGVRTLWFDYEVADAVAGLTGDVEVGMQAGKGGRVSVTLTPGRTTPVTQILALGAGLDARPWRLRLPGVRWYEVDGEEVARLKAQILADAGAQTDAAAPAGGPSHPLTVASYALVRADLAVGGWSDKVVAAGWDPAAPSAVIAEGLTYYIGAAGMDALLAETAVIVPRGTPFICDAMDARGVAQHRARGVAAGGKGLEVAWCYGTAPDVGAEFAGRGWPLAALSYLWAASRRVAQEGERLAVTPRWRMGYEVAPAGAPLSWGTVLLLKLRKA